MAGNYLEQLLAEWYQFSGYFVRQNVNVGRRANGGYECELDVVAFNPKTGHVVHVEPSMDCHPWEKRDERFHKKFEAGRRHIRHSSRASRYLIASSSLPFLFTRASILGTQSAVIHSCSFTSF